MMHDKLTTLWTITREENTTPNVLIRIRHSYGLAYLERKGSSALGWECGALTSVNPVLIARKSSHYGEVPLGKTNKCCGALEGEREHTQPLTSRAFVPRWRPPPPHPGQNASRDWTRCVDQDPPGEAVKTRGDAEEEELISGLTHNIVHPFQMLGFGLWDEAPQKSPRPPWVHNLDPSWCGAWATGLTLVLSATSLPEVSVWKKKKKLLPLLPYPGGRSHFLF